MIEWCGTLVVRLDMIHIPKASFTLFDCEKVMFSLVSVILSPAKGWVYLEGTPRRYMYTSSAGFKWWPPKWAVRISLECVLIALQCMWKLTLNPTQPTSCDKNSQSKWQHVNRPLSQRFMILLKTSEFSNDLPNKKVSKIPWLIPNSGAPRHGETNLEPIHPFWRRSRLVLSSLIWVDLPVIS